MQGVLNISDSEYHANAFDERPALSSSIIHKLVDESPLHAWHAHPKLNPNWRPADSSKQQELGTLVHALVLQGIDRAAVLDFADFRSKAAREARDEARAAGKIPILADKFYDVQQMVKACEIQAKALGVLQNGKPEVTIAWEEDGMLCKARLDWLSNDGRFIDDYKTTSGSANPDQFGRGLFGNGYDIQAAFYLLGVKRVFGVDAKFRFVPQECAAPYALAAIAPGEDVLMLASKKIAFAMDLWRDCLKSGKWPGYSDRVHKAELPPYEENRWLKKELECAA